MKRGTALLPAVAAVYCLGQGHQVIAQMVNITPTRTLTTTTSSTYGSPGSNSSTNTSIGVFNNSISANSNANGLVANPGGLPMDNAVANSSQNTSIADGLFQGSGTASSYTKVVHPAPGESDQATGATSFDTTFSVSVPEFLVLTGNLTATTAYHVGPLAVITGNAELTSSAQGSPLFQATLSNTITINQPSPTNLSTPFTFSVLLQPGQVYDLTVSNSTQSQTGQSGISSDSTSVGFDFTATATAVPEPASIGLILAGAGMLLTRRTRRAR